MTATELEAKLKDLEKRAQRSKDILEIMNLQSRYSYYMELNYTDKIVDELFAQKYPEVKCDLCDTGTYIGLPQVRRLFNALHDQQSIRGFLGVIMVETPSVVIGKDGKTAKGMFHAFGPNSAAATDYPCEGPQQNALTAIWFLGKYANEYVKEGGSWKFSSLKLVSYFQASYKEGWVKKADIRRLAPAPNICKPDIPMKVFKPYHPHGLNIFQPPPPEDVE